MHKVARFSNMIYIYCTCIQTIYCALQFQCLCFVFFFEKLEQPVKMKFYPSLGQNLYVNLLSTCSMVMRPYSTDMEHLKDELAHERAFFVMDASRMTILRGPIIGPNLFHHRY